MTIYPSCSPSRPYWVVQDEEDEPDGLICGQLPPEFSWGRFCIIPVIEEPVVPPCHTRVAYEVDQDGCSELLSELNISDAFPDTVTPFTLASLHDQSIQEYVLHRCLRGFGSSRRQLHGLSWVVRTLLAMSSHPTQPLRLDRYSIHLAVGSGLHLVQRIYGAAWPDEESCNVLGLADEKGALLERLSDCRSFFSQQLHGCGQVSQQLFAMGSAGELAPFIDDDDLGRITQAYVKAVVALQDSLRQVSSCYTLPARSGQHLEEYLRDRIGLVANVDELAGGTQLFGVALGYLRAIQIGSDPLNLQPQSVFLVGYAALCTAGQLTLSRPTSICRWAWAMSLPEALLRRCVWDFFRRLETRFFTSSLLEERVAGLRRTFPMVDDLSVETAIQLQRLFPIEESGVDWVGSCEEAYVPLECLIHTILTGPALGHHDDPATCCAIVLALLDRAWPHLQVDQNELPILTVTAFRLSDKLLHDCCVTGCWSVTSGFPAAAINKWELTLIDLLDGDLATRPGRLNTYLKRIGAPLLKIEPMESLPPPVRLRRPALGLSI
jgi:hypothetical protein